MSSDGDGYLRRARDVMTDGRDLSTKPLRVAGTFLSNISTASWLAVVVLGVTIASLVVTSLISLTHGASLSDDLFESRMGASRSLKASEIERYIGTTVRQVRAMAASETTVAAAQQFSQAYAVLDAAGNEPGRAATDDVASFYRDEFGPNLEATTGIRISWRDLMPTNNAAIHLQNAYLAASPAEPGNERVVDDAGDGSEWSDVHREFHPRFAEITDRLGMHDLYIVEPTHATIVYSTAKAPDFATSLENGPHSGSALASLVRAVQDNPQAGAVSLADLVPHAAALGLPVGFLASPIHADGQLVGILIVHMPLDTINQIMTSGGDWDAEGFGKTGESFLVGSDGRMRSISRLYLEDSDSYFASVDAAGTLDAAEENSVRSLGTTVVFQEVTDRETLREAATGDRDVTESTNYLGRDAAVTYQQLDIEQLDWFVAVETGVEEVDEAIVNFLQKILIVVSLFVVVISFVTVAWARRTLEPLRAASDNLSKARAGEATQNLEMSTKGPKEIAGLAANIDGMIEMANQRQLEVARASAERLDTLRGLLPPVIVERIEVGDRLIVDQILQASVVVAVLDGLGDLIRDNDAATSRAVLDRVVDLLDRLAAQHGLERVKVIGEVYYAGCGLNHAYLDHAPRAVAFALEARRSLRELRLAVPNTLYPALGIHSGPASVGLAGSSRLVYDVWGESLNTAHLLAHRARPGEILISDQTKSMLPAEMVADRWDGEETATIWRMMAESLTGGASP